MDRDAGKEQVYSITSASSGRSDDLGRREKAYGIAMAIRTLCFVGGVIAWQTIGGWVAWPLFAGALILPYTSVILANAGVRSKGRGTDIMPTEPHGALGPGSSGD